MSAAKVESARDTLLAYNPGERRPSQVADHVRQRDGADLAVRHRRQWSRQLRRYLVNDAAYFANKPLVDGTVLLFDGQATVYINQGCYRCLFEAAPTGRRSQAAPRLVAVGAITGIVGSIQATEVMG